MPTTPDPPEEPEPRQNSTRLNRDDRIQVLALRDAGFTRVSLPTRNSRREVGNGTKPISHCGKWE